MPIGRSNDRWPRSAAGSWHLVSEDRFGGFQTIVPKCVTFRIACLSPVVARKYRNDPINSGDWRFTCLLLTTTAKSFCSMTLIVPRDHEQARAMRIAFYRRSNTGKKRRNVIGGA